MNRAYALIEKKSLDETTRTFKGVATTPEMDRVGDTINPMGAKFRNPVTLLHQHKHDAPIGTVKLLKPTANGIEFEASIPIIAEAGVLKDRVDTAWGEIKAGLVRAVSIGFSPLKYAFTDNGGIDFQEIEIYELSTVSIPANAGAIIHTVKSMDKQLRQEAGVAEPDVVPPVDQIKSIRTELRAASGTKQHVVVRLDPPGDSGKTTTVKSIPAPEEGTSMKTVAEQIADFTSTKLTKSQRMEAIMSKAAETGTTLDASQEEEYDTLADEVASVDKHLGRLKALESSQANGAKSVVVQGGTVAVTSTGPSVQVKSEPKLAPGIAFARLAKCKTIARLDGVSPLSVAVERYGENSVVAGTIKAAVAAGSTTSGNWAADLVSAEGGPIADFAEYLRPATILGKFGTNGIPALRQVPFRVPLISQTGGGAGYWVGQGKAKPLTAFDFNRTTMEPLKVANIAVLTEESIRDASPSSEAIVRDSLRDALVARLDTDFVNPAKAAVNGVSPASVTNGAAAIVAAGTDEAAVRLQVRSVFAKFIAASNAPTTGVWIMSATNALALGMMENALGQPEFPGIGMNGGTFQGMPVIVSEYVGSVVALVNASDIYLADEGGVNVDMSRETSLEMSDAPAQDSIAGTGASLVSMFQTNSVALRAERTINWQRRRATSVAYLTGVAWGGAVLGS